MTSTCQVMHEQEHQRIKSTLQEHILLKQPLLPPGFLSLQQRQLTSETGISQACRWLHSNERMVRSLLTLEGRDPSSQTVHSTQEPRRPWMKRHALQVICNAAETIARRFSSNINKKNNENDDNSKKNNKKRQQQNI